MTIVIEVICGLFLAAGASFCLAAAIGLLRFPDVFTRLHASTKALTGGALLVFLGGMPLAGSWAGTLRLALIALFYLLTNSLATHAIARAIRIDSRRAAAQRLIPETPDPLGEVLATLTSPQPGGPR
jgi:multicomponent Na+:H+ antiporter subunit G